MKTIALALLFVLPVIGFCQYTYQNLQVNYLQTDAALKAYSFENLRLYPVYAKKSFIQTFGTVGKYMPLQEAVEKKKVKITEQQNGGDVNALVIENISTDTILVMTGDVVKGGKQDRIIQKDMVLQPKSGKRKLEVFCVESGRWSRRNTTDNRTTIIEDEKAGEAFDHTFNKGSQSLRKIVEKEKAQDKVWSEVDKINKENKSTTSTKTYTAINNSSDYSKKLQAYLNFFSNKFSKDSSVIGVVIVTGNKVIGCDMFATNALFKSQYKTLLHSYITEAILNGKPVNISLAAVKNYVDPLLATETLQQATLKQKGNAFTEKGKKLRVSSFD